MQEPAPATPEFGSQVRRTYGNNNNNLLYEYHISPAPCNPFIIFPLCFPTGTVSSSFFHCNYQSLFFKSSANHTVPSKYFLPEHIIFRPYYNNHNNVHHHPHPRSSRQLRSRRTRYIPRSPHPHHTQLTTTSSPRPSRAHNNHHRLQNHHLLHRRRSSLHLHRQQRRVHAVLHRSIHHNQLRPNRQLLPRALDISPRVHCTHRKPGSERDRVVRLGFLCRADQLCHASQHGD